jgi:hypothetical protein
MFPHPHLVSELVRARQRDLLARADEQRLLRQCCDLARAPQRTGRIWQMIRSAKRSRPAVLPS